MTNLSETRRFGTATPRSLAALLDPRSVAILGASSDATKIGGRPLKFLCTHGFDGPIYPVNPRATEVQGLRAYAALADIPAPVDHAIIALPAQAVLPAVRSCAERGVRAVTVFSSGFAEVDEAGRAAQAELGAIARDSGMRILGPNCMGFMNLRTGFLGTFAFMVDLGLPPLGRVALVSQSGAFGGQALVMAREQGLPLGAWVTTGNECDVELADCIAHFAQDPGTDVIMGYMEGCKTPARLIEALALAQDAGKPVIMVKAGRSDVGRAAVQSHTGALAGDDRVFDALFKEYGVHRAHSVEDFFDVARACATGLLPPETVKTPTRPNSTGSRSRPCRPPRRRACRRCCPMPRCATRWMARPRSGPTCGCSRPLCAPCWPKATTSACCCFSPPCRMRPICSCRWPRSSRACGTSFPRC